MTLDMWRKTMSVNADGVFLGCKYAVQSMKKNDAEESKSIVNISSIAGIIGFPYQGYASSKGAVRLLTKSVALQCASRLNIRCNSVHPGYCDTPLLSGIASEEKKQRISKVAPMGRMGKTAEIANTILFLASNESSYMTGSELIVDGGITAQ
jgi:3(or 17)beta-hydroxysteroid dehydrogenase